MLFRRIKKLLGFVFRLINLMAVNIYFKKKRILGIYDYKALPWSIGDPLLFIEKLNTLKIIHDAEEIDICIIYDRDNPGGNRKEPNINPNNAQDYILEFLPLFSACPYLGSLFQFNSRDEFYLFLKRNLDRYIVFPPLRGHLSEMYNLAVPIGQNHLLEIQEFYIKYGYIPYLRIGERNSDWAKWFYKKHLPENAMPIALSLRQPNSPVYCDRNADPKVWSSFIERCKNTFPEVIFVFIGMREEAWEGLRTMSNVLIAKDFGTTITEDLALIRGSLIYMGTSSGINIIAYFSVLPYLIFQNPDCEFHKIGSGKNFDFATNLQKMFGIETSVTADLIFNEFKEMYSNINKQEWVESSKAKRRKVGLPSEILINDDVN